MLSQQPEGAALGRSLADWRRVTRSELGLPVDRTIIATGHQPTFWHPGILAKYIAVDSLAKRELGGVATLNVIVDQDVVEPGVLEIPLRRTDGSLGTRQFDFAPASSKASRGVPACCGSAFDPMEPQIDRLDLLPCVRDGVNRIWQALRRAWDQPTAAAQVGAALSDLMRECAEIEEIPARMASTLMSTSLARGLLGAMRDDPRRCAEAYNRAAASEPEARIAALLVRDDYVELPLWRVRDDGLGNRGERIRAYDSDIEAASETIASQSKIQNPKSRITLLPRALFMTALIRLAVADLFIHGKGGAMYDRAMERWMRDWLGVDVSPMAVVSATLRLPLMSENDLALVQAGGIERESGRYRAMFHDPESSETGMGQWRGKGDRPGPIKRELLERVNRLLRNSAERRAAFAGMHQRLSEMRIERAAVIQPAMRHTDRLASLARDAAIANRRDWAFPLYPNELLQVLRRETAG